MRSHEILWRPLDLHHPRNFFSLNSIHSQIREEAFYGQNATLNTFSYTIILSFGMLKNLAGVSAQALIRLKSNLAASALVPIGFVFLLICF